MPESTRRGHVLKILAAIVAEHSVGQQRRVARPSVVDTTNPKSGCPVLAVCWLGRGRRIRESIPTGNHRQRAACSSSNLNVLTLPEKYRRPPRNPRLPLTFTGN